MRRALILGLLAVSAPAAAQDPFGSSFWNHWGDGKAELASYDLTYNRYGEPRNGLAVTIFVTETFSEEARVKADPGVHEKDDEYPVLKLNLVQDFPTGIYDYQLMTSAFVALAPRHGRAPGNVTKTTFSAQEWCGHVFAEMLPGRKGVRHVLHSYFDREGDRDDTLEYPVGGFFEDAAFHWARDLAAPFLEPGESRELPMLVSSEMSRLKHRPVEWRTGTLSRSEGTKTVTVDAGTFDVETRTVRLNGPEVRTWTFLVEKGEPHRIVQWTCSDGREARLVASTRTKYWQMNGLEFAGDVAQLGLVPRGKRMP